MCDDAPSRQLLGCRLACAHPSLERFALPSIVKSPICISDTNDFSEWSVWSSFKSWIRKYHDSIEGLDFQGDHDAFQELIAIIAPSRTIRSLRIESAPDRPFTTSVISCQDECTLGFLGYAMDGAPRCDKDRRAYLMRPWAHRTIDRIIKKSPSLRPLMDRTCPRRAVQIIAMQRQRQHFQYAPLPVNIEHLSLIGCVVTSPLPSTLRSLSLDRVTLSSGALPLPSSLRTLRINGALVELGGRLWDVVDMDSWGRLEHLTHFEWHSTSDIDRDRWPKFNFEIVASPRLVHFHSSHIAIQNIDSSTLGCCSGLVTLSIPNGLPSAPECFAAVQHLPLETLTVKAISGQDNIVNLVLPPTTKHADLYRVLGNCINAETFQNVPALHTLKVSGVHREIDLTRLNIWNSLDMLVVPARYIDQLFPDDCITPRTESGIPILTLHMPIDPVEMLGINDADTLVDKVSHVGHLLARFVMYPDECEDVSTYHILAEEIQELMEQKFPHIRIEISDDPLIAA